MFFGERNKKKNMAKKPKKLLFALILIGLLVAGTGCFRSEDTERVEYDAGADSDFDDDDDDDDNDDNDNNDNNNDDDNDSTSWCPVHEVESPPDGIAADPDILCQASDSVAESNKSVLVDLNVLSGDHCLVVGTLNLATTELKGRVVGLPKVEIVDANPEEFKAATVSETRAFGDGFSFDLAFPEPKDECHNPSYLFGDVTEVVLKISFEIDCGDTSGDTKMVSSTTYFNLCGGFSEPLTWVASGGDCEICSQVCEKIASPLPASREEEHAALSGSPKAEIVPVAEYGRKLVLFVDHQGTKGPLFYDWRATGGSIVGTDQPGVIWEVPREPGPHLIQCAVKDSTSAVVATLNWRHRQ